jgi:hypothetical protein
MAFNFWLEHDAVNLNHILLFICLWSRDVLRLTGSHLIASRSNRQAQSLLHPAQPVPDLFPQDHLLAPYRVVRRHPVRPLR